MPHRKMGKTFDIIYVGMTQFIKKDLANSVILFLDQNYIYFIDQ